MTTPKPTMTSDNLLDRLDRLGYPVPSHLPSSWPARVQWNVWIWAGACLAQRRTEERVFVPEMPAVLKGWRKMGP